MSQKEVLKLFEERNVRVVWDDETEKWYFSVVDVCGVLTDQPDYDLAKNYWKVLKHRLIKEGNESVTNCNQLKMVSPKDGKRYNTDVADTEQLFPIIQSIPSTKTEDFEQWLEQFSPGAQTRRFEQLPDLKSVQGEIVLYQPDETIRMEVLLEGETVWLTQDQMAELFQKDQSVIARHINNVFREGELPKNSNMQILHNTLSKFKPTKVYNLNVIISVGYRVKSKRGTQFRIWATSVLKELLLRGYAVNQQLMHVEQRLEAKLDNQQKQIQKIESTLADHQEKIDFFVRTNQPPVEGVLFEGKIFDAYKLVEALVKSAQREIILIDNYIDASIFDLLEKREQGVEATIYTEHVGQSLLHLQQLNLQQNGRKIEVKEYNSRFHDRFLILDDALYHFGASFKDLGRRLFAFERMGIDKVIIMNQL